ncbi:uncharacterized protein RCO7_08767 [Rhynchosporium graminicola]|uniref:C2H2-type domain-containing protein n=1 Tax=Rhynchosporium graminicola TaxID=2792576 RepID=A0A1E1KCN8_9HELO|nr:uncharacterized protein RCO7_08767 [Rhynchosporium commune]
MTTVDILRPSTNDNFYDPDDVGPRDSPRTQAMTVNLVPSPSPPPTVPLPPISADSTPGPEEGRKGPTRSKVRPSQGDAVLIAHMAGGKHIDIARKAGEDPLASNMEGEDAPMDGTTNIVIASVEQKVESQDKVEKEEGKDDTMDVIEEPVAQNNHITPNFLATLAADALRQTERHSPEEAQKNVPPKSPIPKSESPAPEAEFMEGVKTTPIPSIKNLYVDDPSSSVSHLSPERRYDSAAKSPSADGELPPIRHHSPQSSLTNGNGSSQITLPSITAQLGDINHLAEVATAGENVFAQSPPGRAPPRFAAVPSHGSPPKSPNDVFRNQLPSPSGGFFPYPNSNRRPSQSSGEPPPPYQSPNSGSSTETPSSDQSGSTPLLGMNRMSIEGITNPQIGGFQCNYQGCGAAPFQTQYLLNSHRNVHSQNRPHYCSVKGCPRSEGGKGFKRKNEMIRHGLVHDSPGYVCPFCPDREHKYPRPDNLQRHVRVHHVDKDKDDAQLRDVLSQRPEGPSRGRRRRTGTS